MISQIKTVLNLDQSGFKSDDSCIHQSLAITHNICTAFDANRSLGFCGIFLGFFTRAKK